MREEMIRIIEDSLARLGEEYKDRQSQERIRLMIARNRLAEDNIMFAEAGVCRLNTEERKGRKDERKICRNDPFGLYAAGCGLEDLMWK